MNDGVDWLTFGWREGVGLVMQRDSLTSAKERDKWRRRLTSVAEVQWRADQAPRQSLCRLEFEGEPVILHRRPADLADPRHRIRSYAYVGPASLLDARAALAVAERWHELIGDGQKQILPPPLSDARRREMTEQARELPAAHLCRLVTEVLRAPATPYAFRSTGHSEMRMHLWAMLDLLEPVMGAELTWTFSTYEPDIMKEKLPRYVCTDQPQRYSSLSAEHTLIDLDVASRSPDEYTAAATALVDAYQGAGTDGVTALLRAHRVSAERPRADRIGRLAGAPVPVEAAPPSPDPSPPTAGTATEPATDAVPEPLPGEEPGGTGDAPDERPLEHAAPQDAHPPEPGGDTAWAPGGDTVPEPGGNMMPEPGGNMMPESGAGTVPEPWGDAVPGIGPEWGAVPEMDPPASPALPSSPAQEHREGGGPRLAALLRDLAAAQNERRVKQVMDAIEGLLRTHEAQRGDLRLDLREELRKRSCYRAHPIGLSNDGLMRDHLKRLIGLAFAEDMRIPEVACAAARIATADAPWPAREELTHLALLHGTFRYYWQAMAGERRERFLGMESRSVIFALLGVLAFVVLLLAAA